MDWQTIVAILIVAAALGAGGTSVYRALTGKGGCGACGSGPCDNASHCETEETDTDTANGKKPDASG